MLYVNSNWKIKYEMLIVNKWIDMHHNVKHICKGEGNLGEMTVVIYRRELWRIG